MGMCADFYLNVSMRCVRQAEGTGTTTTTTTYRTATLLILRWQWHCLLVEHWHLLCNSVNDLIYCTLNAGGGSWDVIRVTFVGCWDIQQDLSPCHSFEFETCIILFRYNSMYQHLLTQFHHSLGNHAHPASGALSLSIFPEEASIDFSLENWIEFPSATG